MHETVHSDDSQMTLTINGYNNHIRGAEILLDISFKKYRLTGC